MIRIISFIFILAISCAVQWKCKLAISKEFVATILTVFAVIFGFYSTCFAVFATSKYLSRLYKIEDRHDNRKTLLDTLLGEFIVATYFLLGSIIYLVISHVIIENAGNTCLMYMLYCVWGIIGLNLFYAYRTISTFVKVTRQSAKDTESSI